MCYLWNLSRPVINLRIFRYDKYITLLLCPSFISSHLIFHTLVCSSTSRAWSILSLLQPLGKRSCEPAIMAARSLFAASFIAFILSASASLDLVARNDYLAQAPCTYPFTSFNYVGCFADNSTTRALLFSPNLPGQNMTVELCTASCKGKPKESLHPKLDFIKL